MVARWLSGSSGVSQVEKEGVARWLSGSSGKGQVEKEGVARWLINKGGLAKGCALIWYKTAWLGELERHGLAHQHTTPTAQGWGLRQKRLGVRGGKEKLGKSAH